MTCTTRSRPASRAISTNAKPPITPLPHRRQPPRPKPKPTPPHPSRRSIEWYLPCRRHLLSRSDFGNHPATRWLDGPRKDIRPERKQEQSTSGGLRITIANRKSQIVNSSNPLQCLVQIRNQVFHIFQAQRQPHEVVGDAQRLPELRRIIKERHHRHLGHQTFRTSQARRDEK